MYTPFGYTGKVIVPVKFWGLKLLCILSCNILSRKKNGVVSVKRRVTRRNKPNIRQKKDAMDKKQVILSTGEYLNRK
ncbi:hypothetical protein ZY50_24015 [Salmonella enterica subsp. enterica]|nr:hypothetical protein [Salmonella enterica subsp. enterica serovar Newport]EAB5694434.1 hypothetical protein [Salmonella enterica subsp. enterica serovar Newport]EBU6996798.1 hypothetical protein [Salmonella enterica subsp. enterica serovar Newport]